MKAFKTRKISSFARVLKFFKVQGNKMGNKTILDKMSPCDKERFWSKVDTTNPDGCWPWKDSLNKDGYGEISIGDRESQIKLRAHRVAKTLAIGEEIPAGKIVMHMCDNPPCCNPDHVAIATHQENMDDMVRKKRSAVSFGSAKINWDIVDDVRASKLTGKELAQKHGVSRATISEIRNNKIWKEEKRQAAILPNGISV